MDFLRVSFPLFDLRLLRKLNIVYFQPAQILAQTGALRPIFFKTLDEAEAFSNSSKLIEYQGFQFKHWEIVKSVSINDLLYSDCKVDLLHIDIQCGQLEVIQKALH